MIKIIVKRECNVLKSVEVKGHAFFRKMGKDIVCAAISALLQNVYIGLTKIDKLQMNYKTESGLLYLEVLSPELILKKEREKIDFLLNATLTSIKNISSNYNIKVDIII